MRTPPRHLSPKYAPTIQVTHLNVPEGSQEQLIGRTESPPYHGHVNPVFTFDTASLFSRAPSRVDRISAPNAEPSICILPPLRRGSYSHFLPATDSLMVPDISRGVRRQSLSACSRDSTPDGAGLLASPKRRLKPVQSLSIDNMSDFRSQAAPSPGLLSTRSMWSTSDLMHSSYQMHDPETMSNLATSSLSNVSGSLGERMHELVRAFSGRTRRCKERISQPPTPSSTSSYDAKSAVSGVDEPPQPRNIRLGSFLPMGSQTSDTFSDAARDNFVGVGHCRFKLPKCFRKLRFPGTMEPHSKLYVTWLFVVMLAFMYNATVIPLRAVFPYQTPDNTVYFLSVDYVCDFVYIIDMIVFKTRLRFTDNGVVETDYQKTKKHYFRKWMFKFDVLSLLPLDLLYLLPSVSISSRSVWLRLPRMLKIQTFWEFYERCDQAAKSSAHAVRIIKTMTYMLYLIHIETCGYYAVSEYQGIGSTDWVFSGEGNAYIRCFYLATKTATSIGNNPKPTNNTEYLFMTLYWLSGVFVFALLIGQIRDIVEAAGQVKDSYRKKMDAALSYMQSINIPNDIQDRARRWFLYNWEQSKTIDERSLVAALPRKLQTDLAISVHFNTLSKVQLFQDCERNLLYDLVLKLKPNLFLPGDFICRKGEVGKEMYIVSQGHVEVLGGENNELVLARLAEGSVFGEISLLAMSGRGNRRTADVRCAGYTNVFTLSKSDFEEAMAEYPEAQKLLKKRAKKLLKENARRMEKKITKVETEEIIKTPTETPKLVKTVIQVMDPESTVVRHLGSSLKRTSSSKSHTGNHLQVPGPVAKTTHRAQRNMAFDISDEQVQSTPEHPLQTEEEWDKEDVDSEDEDELLVVERIEQNLPDLDVNDDDDFDNDNNDDGNDDDDGDVFQNCEDILSDADFDLDDGESVKVQGSVSASDVTKVTSEDDVAGSKRSSVGEKEATHAQLGTEGLQEGKQAERSKSQSRSGSLRRAAMDESGTANNSVESQDSGLPSQDSRDSFNSLDMAAAREQQPLLQQHRQPDGVAAQAAGSEREKLSCGCRGTMEKCEAHSILSRKLSAGSVTSRDLAQLQDSVQVPAQGRIRKVSTVSLPDLPTDGSRAPNLDLTTVVPRSSDSKVMTHSNIHREAAAGVGIGAGAAMTPVETVVDLEKRLERLGGNFPQLNGDSSRKSSNESQCMIPAENQITCAVEIHREKTKTPTAMLSMTEQPSASSTPRTSPSRPQLPYECASMRETIV